MRRPRGPGAGLTLIETLIVIGIIGVIIAIVIPAIARSRAATQRKTCILNLRAIDAAKEQFAIEKRKLQGATVRASDITPYMRGNQMPVCKGGGTYSIQRVGRDPRCSLWRKGHFLQDPNSIGGPEPE